MLTFILNILSCIFVLKILVCYCDGGGPMVERSCSNGGPRAQRSFGSGEPVAEMSCGCDGPVAC